MSCLTLSWHLPEDALITIVARKAARDVDMFYVYWPLRYACLGWVLTSRGVRAGYKMQQFTRAEAENLIQSSGLSGLELSPVASTSTAAAPATASEGYW